MYSEWDAQAVVGGTFREQRTLTPALSRGERGH